jgi:hypothetical protein
MCALWRELSRVMVKVGSAWVVVADEQSTPTPTTPSFAPTSSRHASCPRVWSRRHAERLRPCRSGGAWCHRHHCTSTALHETGCRVCRFVLTVRVGVHVDAGFRFFTMPSMSALLALCFRLCGSCSRTAAASLPEAAALASPEPSGPVSLIASFALPNSASLRTPTVEAALKIGNARSHRDLAAVQDFLGR